MEEAEAMGGGDEPPPPPPASGGAFFGVVSVSTQTLLRAVARGGEGPAGSECASCGLNRGTGERLARCFVASAAPTPPATAAGGATAPARAGSSRIPQTQFSRFRPELLKAFPGTSGCGAPGGGRRSNSIRTKTLFESAVLQFCFDNPHDGTLTVELGAPMDRCPGAKETPLGCCLGPLLNHSPVVHASLPDLFACHKKRFDALAKRYVVSGAGCAPSPGNDETFYFTLRAAEPAADAGAAVHCCVRRSRRCVAVPRLVLMRAMLAGQLPPCCRAMRALVKMTNPLRCCDAKLRVRKASSSCSLDSAIDELAQRRLRALFPAFSGRLFERVAATCTGGPSLDCRTAAAVWTALSRARPWIHCRLPVFYIVTAPLRRMDAAAAMLASLHEMCAAKRAAALERFDELLRAALRDCPAVLRLRGAVALLKNAGAVPQTLPPFATPPSRKRVILERLSFFSGAGPSSQALRHQESFTAEEQSFFDVHVALLDVERGLKCAEAAVARFPAAAADACAAVAASPGGPGGSNFWAARVFRPPHLGIPACLDHCATGPGTLDNCASNWAPTLLSELSADFLPEEGRRAVERFVSDLVQESATNGLKNVWPDMRPALVSNFILDSCSLEEVHWLLVAVLLEARIAVVSTSSERRTAAVLALRELIRPLEWMHPCLPVVPRGWNVRDLLDSPVPIIAGTAPVENLMPATPGPRVYLWAKRPSSETALDAPTLLVAAAALARAPESTKGDSTLRERRRRQSEFSAQSGQGGVPARKSGLETAPVTPVKRRARSNSSPPVPFRSPVAPALRWEMGRHVPSGPSNGPGKTFVRDVLPDQVRVVGSSSEASVAPQCETAASRVVERWRSFATMPEFASAGARGCGARPERPCARGGKSSVPPRSRVHVCREFSPATAVWDLDQRLLHLSVDLAQCLLPRWRLFLANRKLQCAWAGGGGRAAAAASPASPASTTASTPSSGSPFSPISSAESVSSQQALLTGGGASGGTVGDSAGGSGSGSFWKTVSSLIFTPEPPPPTPPATAAPAVETAAAPAASAASASPAAAVAALSASAVAAASPLAVGGDAPEFAADRSSGDPTATPLAGGTPESETGKKGAAGAAGGAAGGATVRLDAATSLGFYLEANIAAVLAPAARFLAAAAAAEAGAEGPPTARNRESPRRRMAWAGADVPGAAAGGGEAGAASAAVGFAAAGAGFAACGRSTLGVSPRSPGVSARRGSSGGPLASGREDGSGSGRSACSSSVVEFAAPAAGGAGGSAGGAGSWRTFVRSLRLDRPAALFLVRFAAGQLWRELAAELAEGLAPA